MSSPIKITGRVAAAVALTLASLWLVVPTRGGGGTARHLKQAAPVVLSAPLDRGGIHYDAAAALEAVVTPKFDPKSPPTGALTYRVTYRGGGHEIVPGILMIPASSKDRVPCVILLHGLGGSKEQVLLLAAGLATHGYASLSVDIAGHGERPKIDDKKVQELNLIEMRTLAGQTVVDLRRGVDFIQSRPEIDSRRIGFLGISLGGIIGGVFAGDEPRVKAVVLWAAGGDWGKMATLSTHPFAKQFRATGSTDALVIEKTMSDVDPLTTVSNIAPRPLLMINGDRDTVVPVVCANELADAASQPKERITLPGGHIPDALLMLSDSEKWLDRHLKK